MLSCVSKLFQFPIWYVSFDISEDYFIRVIIWNLFSSPCHLALGFYFISLYVISQNIFSFLRFRYCVHVRDWNPRLSEVVPNPSPRCLYQWTFCVCWVCSCYLHLGHRCRKCCIAMYYVFFDCWFFSEYSFVVSHLLFLCHNLIVN